MGSITVYGAMGSGSIAVEATLSLLGLPHRLVEGATWSEEWARERVGAVERASTGSHGRLSGRQRHVRKRRSFAVPRRATSSSGTRASHRRSAARPIPALDVSSAIYALHWIKPDVCRVGASSEQREAVVDAVHRRIAFCWSNMDEQLSPGRYLLGNRLTVLDLYVTVVSRFGPWRTKFYEVAPKMTPVVKRVDDEPRLAEFWTRRFPFEDGWE